MATPDASKLFDASKPFNPKTVSHKFITFTAAAKRHNRMILQQNYDVEENCPICLDSMLDKPVIYTPCKHRFHSKCMFALLSSQHLSKYNCPMCRHDLWLAVRKIYSSPIVLVSIITIIEEEDDEEEVENEETGNEATDNEVGANEVGANEVGANAVAANEVGANAGEPISLFDEESEEEYEDEDDSQDEDYESEIGDAWGVFL
jgi:hypothetical protein